MHIQHRRPDVGTLGHDGRQYTALRDGIFNVPDDVGTELIQRADWTRYYGEAPYQIASAPPATEEAPAAKTEPETTPEPISTASEEAARQGQGIDWFAKGEEAARAGAPRLPLPDELKDRPRHRDARTYLAGHNSIAQPEHAQA